MDKKKIKGGLEVLFTPAKGKQAEEQQAEEQAAERAAEQAPAADIIETVEDEKLKAALKAARCKNSGRPRKDSTAERTSDKYKRITNIVSIDQIEKIKEISYREGITIKEVIEAAFELAIKTYEEQHGEIKSHRAKKPFRLTK